MMDKQASSSEDNTVNDMKQLDLNSNNNNNSPSEQLSKKFEETSNTHLTAQELLPLGEDDIEQVKKITSWIIDKVKLGKLNDAAKILQDLSININSNVNVSDIPIIKDNQYQRSVFHILQDEGLITEANAFGSYCKGLGYIDEFYYEF